MSGLTSKDNILERAKQQRNLSERILSAIPGFKGYKEKELRRESDRLIRDHLYRRLRESEDVLKKTFQRISDDRAYGVMEEVDRLVMEFDRVKARIDHASYGYAGFFDVMKIDERDLDEMLSFDAGLIDNVENLSKQVQALKDYKVEEGVKPFDSISENLSILDDTFDQRKEKIMGVA